MRGRSAVRNDELQLDLFGLRLPALQVVDSAVPESREALVSIPAEESGRCAIERSSESDATTVRPPTEDAADNVVVLPSPGTEPEPPRNQNNHRITKDDRVGLGSLKQKCRANLAAIELLKQIEAENRAASDEEKRVLVRYVGWVGLPQVFDAGNEPWAKDRGQLEKLLTPEELDSARATTLNAHYTSPAVIRAMYAALERFSL